MVWAKFDDKYPDNPKIVALSDAAFRLHASAICYSAAHLLDGRIPKAAAHRYVARGVAAAKELLESGLFADDGDFYQVHDFLDYNPTAEQVTNIREARARSGRKGGLSKRTGNPQANSQANASANAKQTEEQKSEQNGTPYPYPVPYPNGDLEKSQTALAQRLSAVCKKPDPIDALLVVNALAEHVDWKIIDECIGWAEQRDENQKPNSPRYFLKTVADWGRKRGVVVPDLHPEGLVS